MRAIYADGDVLSVREVPQPRPGKGHVLIRVRAAGLNYADRMVMRGRYVVGRSAVARGGPDASAGAGSAAAAKPVAMGGEAAGEVEAVGDGVEGFAVGDRVMAMCNGAFADYALADARRCWPVPNTLSWPEAAGAPVTFATAHDALTTAGLLQPGGTVLVNAASSGVGVAAIQLAGMLGAGTVIASTTSPAKLAALADAGVRANVGLVAGEGFASACMDATGWRGADVIVDNVGAPALADNIAVAAVGGRVVSVGRLGGRRAEIDLDEVARKRVSLIGVTFRTRSPEQAGAVFAKAALDVVPALADGRLRVLVDRTFGLDEAAAAEEYLASRQHVGKVVLLA